jgi:uncharacterized membrane protein YcaP (DUF421 family)
MHAQAFRDMFILGLPIVEKVIRPILVYAFLVVALRLAGKRELAQLNPFDLVVLLTLSNTVQNAIIGEDNSITGGVIGAATLLLMNHIVVRFLYRHERLEHLIECAPGVLIENGAVVAATLEKEVITKDELIAAAHKQGFAGLDEIERAVLESSGSITFIARKPTTDAIRHDEIVTRLDRLAADLAALRQTAT